MSATEGVRPTPYHRLATLRPAWSSWQKPLLTLAAAFIAYLVLASVLLVFTILVLALAPGVNVAIGVTSGDPTSPLDVALALAMGALWWPAGLVGVRVGGWRPPRVTWSVAARMRRELLRSMAALVVIGALVVAALAALAGLLAGPGAAPDPAADASTPVLPLLLVVVLVLVLAPIQAIGLELTLRGVVLQAVGTWLRGPILPILVTAALALIGRQLTPAVVIPALTLALAAALLAWKTGGLELPILLTLTLTVSTMIVSALAAGTGAGAGASALGAAVAAPGTSGASLAAPEAAAAWAGGVVGAVALVALTVVIMVVVGRRENLRLLEPVGRPAAEPVPEPVPF
ncbi:CAAX protease [Brachybacterium sp. P6-10-X1]|uniref:CPBP family glutamic-type intramembrane protease n=1 Tax=Brachybacterium sp. P6-10-X1 TaxID=1903186 RepID=UPI0009719F06|nr:CPBP family glutamic-type intramembrane protease [Brachybacterium sp. P6-10-X1]APX33739.1 CAAX protease [Brachybacterium sp. P6-10-X1]